MTESVPAPARKIIHVDMDAFYASVEVRDRPELRGRPVAVGGSPGGRGVIASASYEARKFGVRSAMPSTQAKRLCPELIFVSPDFSKYTAASEKIHAIFATATDLVEPLSLDEAYLDVTTNKLGLLLARDIAVHIKDRIQKELGLTASAGVGPYKFIAKVASDLRKPNGLVVVPPEKVAAFVERLPVERFWGVGPATAGRLRAMGFRTAADIRASTGAQLEALLGKYGEFLFDLAHGRDDREVHCDSEPRSRGAETTFDKDTRDLVKLQQVLQDLAEEVGDSLGDMQRLARTVTLKIRYRDFTTLTRSQTFLRPIDDASRLATAGLDLLTRVAEGGLEPVRLIGLSVSNLIHTDEPRQLWLDLPEWA